LKEFIAALELSSITRLHPGFMYCLKYNGHLLVWFHEHLVNEQQCCHLPSPGMWYHRCLCFRATCCL